MKLRTIILLILLALGMAGYLIVEGLRQVGSPASASWRSAADVRRQGMPTEVARQEMCRVEPEESCLLQGDLSPRQTGVFCKRPSCTEFIFLPHK